VIVRFSLAAVMNYTADVEGGRSWFCERSLAPAGIRSRRPATPTAPWGIRPGRRDPPAALSRTCQRRHRNGGNPKCPGLPFCGRSGPSDSRPPVAERARHSRQNYRRRLEPALPGGGDVSGARWPSRAAIRRRAGWANSAAFVCAEERSACSPCPPRGTSVNWPGPRGPDLPALAGKPSSPLSTNSSRFHGDATHRRPDVRPY